MYWSAWITPARIEAANMDGTGRQIFVQGGGLARPNGLSIDYASRKLYWSDEMTSAIESVNLDGSDRKMILLTTGHPFGLDVHNGFVYWTDWTRHELLRAKITDPSSEAVLRTGLEGVMEVRVYDSKRQTGGKFKFCL